MKEQKKISLAEYALHHNPKLTRRGKRMSESYLYRLIRESEKDELTRDLWFEYVMEGEKDHIYIILAN